MTFVCNILKTRILPRRVENITVRPGIYGKRRHSQIMSSSNDAQNSDRRGSGGRQNYDNRQQNHANRQQNCDNRQQSYDYRQQNRQRNQYQQQPDSPGNQQQYYNSGQYQRGGRGKSGDRGRGQDMNTFYDQRGQNWSFGRGQPGGYGGQQSYMQRGSSYDQQYNFGSQYQRRRQDEDDDTFISKTLSYILRHGAEKQGFQLMKGGFLYVDEIIKRTQKLHGVKIEDIERIVKSNDKQRFALETDENGRLKIRANQGHTLEVEELQLEEITSADQVEDVIHGTYYSSWEIIKKSGLSRMGRNHVHFAPGEPGESGVISGMRKTCEVLILIDIEKALNDGLKFYRSANNVILCPGDEKGIIYPCYFKAAVSRHPRHVLEFDNTITKDTVKHEPQADAGKYSGKKKKEQLANLPVGMSGTVDDKSPKKKKNKRKKKDKEFDEEETEHSTETAEENSKRKPKRKATEEEKDVLDCKDVDPEGASFVNMFDEPDKDGENRCEENGENSLTNNTEELSESNPIDASDKQHEETETWDNQTEGKWDNNEIAVLSLSENHISNEEVVEPSTSSASTNKGNNRKIEVILNPSSSMFAVDRLLEEKPEALAVCCYGDKLGRDESHIRILSLVTDDQAYLYYIRDGDDRLILEGRVRVLLEDPDIVKVFTNIKPQSLGLLQEYDIVLDGTPIWDLEILYENCAKNLSADIKERIAKENLYPADWDDEYITPKMKDKVLKKETQTWLVKRGSDMLKLFSYFSKEEMREFKRDMYHAANPTDGELLDKFNALKEERKQERERKKKEEKQREQQKQQPQTQKKHKKKRK